MDRIVGMDLRGVSLCMKYEIPRMLPQGGGAIVNTSQVLGSEALRAASLRRREVRRDRADQICGPRLRAQKSALTPSPRHIDTPMMGRFTGGTAEGRARLSRRSPRRMGSPRSRRGRRLALLGRGRLRRRARHDHRRRPNGAVTLVTSRDGRPNQALHLTGGA